MAGLAALLSSACASPLGGEDLELSLGAAASPGIGGLAGLAQRVWQDGARRVDFELELLHMELAESGPTGGDDWDEVRAGLRLRPAAEEGPLWFGRAGVVWLRAEGEPEFLDKPGDYGGLYLGGGVQFALARAWRTGPELTFLGVDAEGSDGGSGVVAELAWRFTWRL